MKHNNIIRNELSSLSSDKKELNELMDLVSKIEKTTPKLHRKDKKHIIAGILPAKKAYAFRYSYTFATAFAIVVTSLIATPHVTRSQPGDPLYSIKQGVEAVRNIVQPNFVSSSEVEDSKKDEDSHQDDSGHSSDDDQNIDPDEKKEDNSGSGSSKSGPGSAKSSDDSDGDDGPRSGSSGSDNDDHDNESEQESSSHSSRDACRNALDVRKQNGEDIDSDDYQDCDEL